MQAVEALRMVQGLEQSWFAAAIIAVAGLHSVIVCERFILWGGGLCRMAASYSQGLFWQWDCR